MSFKAMYQLGHPEYCEFYITVHKLFTGSKYLENFTSDFENKIAVQSIPKHLFLVLKAQSRFRMPGLCDCFPSEQPW